MKVSQLVAKVKKGGEDSVLSRLDKFLMLDNHEENDRAVDVNSPSQVYKCMRALYYSRKHAEKNGVTDARLQRIFDNGTHMHLRLQKYLTDAGLLVMDECPCIEEELNIQGHTDGILKLSNTNYAILELKSINSHAYGQLKAVKPEHKAQAMIYMYCTEVRRLDLVSMTEEEFKASEGKRKEFYTSRYQHLKSGKKFTREEKIQHNVDTNMKLDEILYSIKTPIRNIIFLYENKDTQEIKEFKVAYDDDLMSDIQDFYLEVNYYCDNDIEPPIEGTSKSCNICRWCDYTDKCFD